MTVFETIPEVLAESSSWNEEGGVWWLNYNDLNVREVAEAMNALQARFITITAYQLPKDEGLRLEYHWDIDGRLLGFVFLPAANPSQASTTSARP